MRAFTRSAFVSAVRLSPLVGSALVLAAALAAGSARAGNPVAVIVLKEHGIGSPTQAQPYLNQFVTMAAQQNGWAGAKGQYQTKRGEARTWIGAEKPNYGIFTLAAFLDLKGAYGLEPIGSATLANGGGEYYFVVSKNATNIDGCKGKPLATDHFDDPKFIEKVVARGVFTAQDFALVPTTRFGEAGRKVLNDQAECALIDDAQLADLMKTPGAAAIKKAWSSNQLPPMVVAAFQWAPAAEKTAFQASLPKICQGSGQQICAQVGLQTLGTASAQTYQSIVTAYNKP